MTPSRFLCIVFAILELIAAVLAGIQASAGTVALGGYAPWMVEGLFAFALSLIIP